MGELLLQKEPTMIVIRVELHSAIHPSRSKELARMLICNDETGGPIYRNYLAQVLRGRSKEQLDKRTVLKTCAIKGWPSERVHIWNLIAFALEQMGYGQHGG